MLPKNLTANRTRTVIVSSITLILGVLFCCSMSFGEGLSYLIGGSLCFAGVLFIINAITDTKTLLSTNGIVGAASISFGVMFMVDKLAHILVDFVPYLMIAIGVVIIVEAFLMRFPRYGTMAVFIVLLVAGAVITTLGLCLMFIDSFSRVAAVVFGCLLIVASLYTLISLALKKK